MKRILAVDDEQELLDVVREYFEGRYELVTATSGAVALEAFCARRPDVVFLDINMPGMTGIEVLKACRALDATVPIIMVTVSTEVAIAEQCMREGAFAFVPKPFDLNYMDHMAAVTADQSRRRG